jgi:hypothetical protein
MFRLFGGRQEKGDTGSLINRGDGAADVSALHVLELGAIQPSAAATATAAPLSSVLPAPAPVASAPAASARAGDIRLYTPMNAAGLYGVSTMRRPPAAGGRRASAPATAATAGGTRDLSAPATPTPETKGVRASDVSPITLAASTPGLPQSVRRLQRTDSFMALQEGEAGGGAVPGVGLFGALDAPSAAAAPGASTVAEAADAAIRVGEGADDGMPKPAASSSTLSRARAPTHSNRLVGGRQLWSVWVKEKYKDVQVRQCLCLTGSVVGMLIIFVSVILTATKKSGPAAGNSLTVEFENPDVVIAAGAMVALGQVLGVIINAGPGLSEFNSSLTVALQEGNPGVELTEKPPFARGLRLLDSATHWYGDERWHAGKVVPAPSLVSYPPSFVLNNINSTTDNGTVTLGFGNLTFAQLLTELVNKTWIRTSGPLNLTGILTVSSGAVCGIASFNATAVNPLPSASPTPTPGGSPTSSPSSSPSSTSSTSGTPSASPSPSSTSSASQTGTQTPSPSSSSEPKPAVVVGNPIVDAGAINGTVVRPFELANAGVIAPEYERLNGSVVAYPAVFSNPAPGNQVYFNATVCTDGCGLNITTPIPPDQLNATLASLPWQVLFDASGGNVTVNFSTTVFNSKGESGIGEFTLIANTTVPNPFANFKRNSKPECESFASGSSLDRFGNAAYGSGHAQ